MDYDDPTFLAGVDLGKSLGRFGAEVEAIKAHEMGEIDMYIEWVTPKSLEEWDEWEKKYGEDFENRWKYDKGDNDE